MSRIIFFPHNVVCLTSPRALRRVHRARRSLPVRRRIGPVHRIERTGRAGVNARRTRHPTALAPGDDCQRKTRPGDQSARDVVDVPLDGGPRRPAASRIVAQAARGHRGIGTGALTFRDPSLDANRDRVPAARAPPGRVKPPSTFFALFCQCGEPRVPPPR